VTRLSDRKTRLSFETGQTARYRSKDRAIIVEPDMRGDVVAFRLKGTRVRFELTWRGVYDHAAAVAAERLLADRRQRSCGETRPPMSKAKTDTRIKVSRSKRYKGEISSVNARGLKQIEGFQIRVFRTKRGEVMLGFYTIEPRHQDKKHPELVTYSYHVVTFTADKDGRVTIGVKR
jgi:hypothetical protein